MGAYLSSPITQKEIIIGDGKDLKYGVSAMQGWRRTMEDCHIADVSLGGDADFQIFGVFDGHGGAEVARFSAKYLASQLLENKNFQQGNYEEALIQSFHRIDELLREPEYISELDNLRNQGEEDDQDDITEANDSGDKKDESRIENHVTGTTTTLDLIKKLLQLHTPNNKQNSDKTQEIDIGDSSSSSTEEQNGTQQAQAEMNIQAGCAAVVMLKKGNIMYLANAGDSRAVLCRSGKSVGLTFDHKPTSEKERKRIESAGGFVSDIGGIYRVNGNLNLSRAIGDLRYKTNIKIPPKDQVITAQPDVYKFLLKPEDEFVILACDGIWDCMTNQEAVDFVRSRLAADMPLEMIHTEILEHCLADDPKYTKGVGCDNMTIIIVLLNVDHHYKEYLQNVEQSQADVNIKS